MQIVSNNVNFTGRCPAIKQGQWAVHCVNAYLPHQSAFRYGQHMDYYTFLYKINHKVEPNRSVTFPQKFLNVIPKNFKLNDRIIGMSEEYLVHAKDSFQHAIAPIRQMLETHIGACHENACAAESILRANGIAQPVIATLSYGNNTTRHVVCLFNRDGSKVEQIVPHKTVVVDPLFGIVDFLNNAEKTYRNIFSKCIETKKDKLNIKSVAEHRMTSDDIIRFKEQFPKFIQTKRPD